MLDPGKGIYAGPVRGIVSLRRGARTQDADEEWDRSSFVEGQERSGAFHPYRKVGVRRRANGKGQQSLSLVWAERRWAQEQCCSLGDLIASFAAAWGSRAFFEVL